MKIYIIGGAALVATALFIFPRHVKSGDNNENNTEKSVQRSTAEQSVLIAQPLSSTTRDQSFVAHRDGPELPNMDGLGWVVVTNPGGIKNRSRHLEEGELCNMKGLSGRFYQLDIPERNDALLVRYRGASAGGDFCGDGTIFWLPIDKD